MKKHYFFFEIALNLLIFFLWILPNVFSSPSNLTAFSKWSFPLNNLIFLILAFLISFVEIKNNEGNFKNLFCIKLNKLPKKILTTLVSLLLLFLIETALQFIAVKVQYQIPETNVRIPEDMLEFCFCSLTFFFAAFFEELIFRFYEPYSLEKISGLLPKKNQKKLISELVSALLFSVCHFYLGIFATINAFAAHFVLRYCFKKTSSIIFPLAAHFFYNLLSLYIFMTL